MIKIPEEINLENYTLILPSVAVGNVGQLCTDLLISNLNLNKVGSMWNPVFLPICGLDPYNKNCQSLCTAADFYLETYHKIIVLHLRAPHIGPLNDFFDKITQFIKQKKISKVIILSSSYDYECADKSDSSLRYLTTDNSLLNNEKFLESLTWKRHVKKTSTESAKQYYIPGGGFANGFYDYLKSIGIPCTVLFCYCSEGDNIPDALILFKGLNQWLNLLKENTDYGIKYPPSWEYLFGNPPSLEIY
ncbi:Proteasome assembly chaperone 2 [Habropoda laboriosa]|uniref:Proteasome assembly chaperone 2 n=1 Tax=Habropoda laboriosa TaxID=597456 RepID=A0A0L7RHC6_9HYME|nr:PREDICTED: proteasome assembly chaperone 2 [Habropoda laboriosa]KOC70224.1 Proteasome assembly chaperone 2 [Habropoda laboriosa]